MDMISIVLPLEGTLPTHIIERNGEYSFSTSDVLYGVSRGMIRRKDGPCYVSSWGLEQYLLLDHKGILKDLGEHGVLESAVNSVRDLSWYEDRNEFRIRIDENGAVLKLVIREYHARWVAIE